VLNLHHLELFYHVARCGGITAAVRQMPYGIGQPAVSSQIAALETTLGVRLFQRRPFALTDPGRELYAFIAPFFIALPGMEARLAATNSFRLRLAASNSVLRDHLPGLLREARDKAGTPRLSLREMDQSTAEKALCEGQLDAAIVVRERAPATGMRFKALLGIPLALAYRKADGVPSLKRLFASSATDRPPLITPPPRDRTTQIFFGELAKRGIVWEPEIEASNLDVVHACVAEGFGVGLTLSLPAGPLPTTVAVMRLSAFAELQILALWKGQPDPPLADFLQLVESYAARLRR